MIFSLLSIDINVTVRRESLPV